MFDIPAKAQELAREYARLKDLTAAGERYLKVRADLAEHAATLKTEPADSELAQLAREEITQLQAEETTLARKLQGLAPPDPADSRNTIIEIRAGAGGSESALFAADLYRMFTRYAEKRGWKVENMDSSPSDLGGFKEIIFGVTGTDVFKRLKYESGVHRVQRVPATEAQGRIHTSTATVAVLPGGGGGGHRNPARRVGDQRLPRLGQGRPGRQYHRFRRADHPQTDRHDRPLRRRALAAEEQSHRHDRAALAPARTSKSPRKTPATPPAARTRSAPASATSASAPTISRKTASPTIASS